MITVVSKSVLALRNSPRMYQEPFDRIQEWLSGVNPMAPSVRRHDSGKLREVFPDLSPAGRAETGGAGDTLSHDDVGSGYGKDVDLYGGRADDETGPGNTRNHDPEQNFTDHSTSELAFKNDFDTSSPLNPMNEDSNKRDRNSTQNLLHLMRRPKVQTRNRAAQVWQHTFKV